MSLSLGFPISSQCSDCIAPCYGGYDGVVAGNSVVRAGCWAYLRRKVIDAENTAPEIAQEAIVLVGALYAVEKQGRDASAEERVRLRQEQSASVVAELHEDFFDWKEQLLPKHPMAKAIRYALGRSEELNVFLADGAVSIDNNAAERVMKRVVLRPKFGRSFTQLLPQQPHRLQPPQRLYRLPSQHNRLRSNIKRNCHRSSAASQMVTRE